MPKLLLLTIYFLLFTAFANAQHTYEILRKIDSFNTLNQAIIQAPNNLILRAERIDLLTYYHYHYNDTSVLMHFDKTIILEDLNTIIAKDTSIVYNEQVQDKGHYLNLKIKLLKELNIQDETLEQTYQSLLDFLLLNTIDTTNPSHQYIITDLIDFYYIKALAEENPIQKAAYVDKALNTLSLVIPMQALKDFDINKPIAIPNFESNRHHLFNIPYIHPNKDLAIQYYKGIIKYYYTTIIDTDSISWSISDLYNNIMSFAYRTTMLYAEHKDYNNAITWANAFLKDTEIQTKNNSIYTQFPNSSNYHFDIYQILYTYYAQQAKPNFDSIVNNIFNMILYVRTDLQEELEKLNPIIELHAQQGANNAKYHLAKANLKFIARRHYYKDYETYGKSLLALLDKTKALGLHTPEMDFMYGVVYIEYFKDEAMAKTFFQKVLNIKKHPLHQTIQRLYMPNINLEKEYIPYTPPKRMNMNLAIVELAKK